MLFLNFGNLARAEEFLAKRLSQGMSDAQIKAFDVSQKFLDNLRSTAVPESLAKYYPYAPIKVDLSKAADQFGLRKEQIEALMREIVQGSGRILK